MLTYLFHLFWLGLEDLTTIVAVILLTTCIFVVLPALIDSHGRVTRANETLRTSAVPQSPVRTRVEHTDDKAGSADCAADILTLEPSRRANHILRFGRHPGSTSMTPLASRIDGPVTNKGTIADRITHTGNVPILVQPCLPKLASRTQGPAEPETRAPSVAQLGAPAAETSCLLRDSLDPAQDSQSSALKSRPTPRILDHFSIFDGVPEQTSEQTCTNLSYRFASGKEVCETPEVAETLGPKQKHPSTPQKASHKTAENTIITKMTELPRSRRETHPPTLPVAATENPVVTSREGMNVAFCWPRTTPASNMPCSAVRAGASVAPPTRASTISADHSTISSNTNVSQERSPGTLPARADQDTARSSCVPEEPSPTVTARRPLYGIGATTYKPSQGNNKRGTMSLTSIWTCVSFGPSEPILERNP